MRKGFFTFIATVVGLYLVLHLVLGSSPVQKRIVEEVRKELEAFGLELNIESIELSYFTPKIYLNRVTLKAGPHAKVPLPEPVAIDKIKIEFQPLALLSRRIVFEEIVLFHPRIVHPNLDRLVKRIEQLAAQNKSDKKSAGTGFALHIKKIGVVDALLEIASKEPALAIRTRSFTAFLLTSLSQQQSVTVETKPIEIDRGPLKLVLQKVELDADLSRKSLRINRAFVDSDALYLNVKGVSSLPAKGETLMDTLNGTFEIKLALSVLNQIPELKVPKLGGRASLSGNANMASRKPAGKGHVHYENVTVEEYKIGGGDFDFNVADGQARLSDVIFRWAQGELRTASLKAELKEPFPVEAEFSIRDVKLEGIFDAVDEAQIPVKMNIAGGVKLTGGLMPLGINLDVKAKVAQIQVLDKTPVKVYDNILEIGGGNVDGRLSFTTERMGFNANVETLGGNGVVEGFLGFGEADSHVRIKGNKLSLTDLKHISDLRFAGLVDLTGNIDQVGDETKISAKFSGTDTEIADVVIGTVKGDLFYQDDLLSFENLESPSIEPIQGSGFVDFRPEKTHYRFIVETRRAAMNQVFNTFRRMKMGFTPPTGGDVGARLSLEGGHDALGMEIQASGVARGFSWFDEKWVSATYDLRYREDAFTLNRAVLYKRGGGIEARGKFGSAISKLELESRGLRIEELDHLDKAPLAGEIGGGVTVEMKSGKLVSAVGEIKTMNASFRGSPLPESLIRIRPVEAGIEFLGTFAGEGMKARFVKEPGNKNSGELLLYFLNFDFSPFLAILVGKDIPSITDVTASGDFSLAGDLTDWNTLKGSGTFTQVKLGLKGTPMRNRQPVQLKLVNGALEIERFHLVGSDSQVSLDFLYRPKEKLQGSLDGKLDLQFIQPFIPGLEYGAGKVTAAARLSGTPAKFELLGNVTLEDGSFRLTGLQDEFRAVDTQLSISQERINIDRFSSRVNGGAIEIRGDVRINKFQSMAPNLKILADSVLMKFQDSLATKFSGEFSLKGAQMPYLLSSSKCRVLEGYLTKLEGAPASKASTGRPTLAFDVTCEAKDRLYVKAPIMDAEFKGDFHIVGNTNQLGLLGAAESLGGVILFRETRFNLDSGSVRFESPTRIAPRFNVTGRALVREAKSGPQQQEYEVTLLVFGTPADYRIRLSSSPALAEADVISLLILGVTSRGQEGNYLDLGSALAGQIPLQSKLKDELGFDINVTTRTQQGTGSTGQSTGTSTTGTSSAVATDVTVPSVRIQKSISRKTKVSYSNTLESSPVREFKIEQMLDDNFTVNATATGNPRGSSTNQTSQAYGVDVRYRFSFE